MPVMAREHVTEAFFQQHDDGFAQAEEQVGGRALAGAHDRAGQTGWPIHDLRAGHDAMVTAPAATAELIAAIAAN